MWEHDDKLFLSVSVNSDSVLGLIAEAQSQMECLKQTLQELKTAVAVKEADPEEPASK